MEDNLILTPPVEPCDPLCDVIPTYDNDTQITQCDIQCGTCDDPLMLNTGDEEENKQHVEFSKLAAILQDSVMYAWREHLKTNKYFVHITLEEYYDEAFDIIDDLIERYQGICKCNIVNNAQSPVGGNNPYNYFINLKDYLLDFVNNQNNFNDKTNEIKSDIDDLLRLIDSTLYKLGNLTESKIKSFEEFIYENYK
jgi:hypothetical protein